MNQPVIPASSKQCDTHVIPTDEHDRFIGLVTSLGLPEEVHQQVLLALDVASVAHRGQTRPDGSPYIQHPLRVALAVATKFGVTDPALLMAALLHDTVEDKALELIIALGGAPSSSAGVQHEALACIERHFGPRTAEVVGHLTNPDFDALVVKAQANGDPREKAEIKRELYKEHFLEILAQDPEAFLIKLSDFGENAYKLGDLSSERRAPLVLKYGPVILAVVEELERLSSDHTLYRFRDSLCAELREVYARDYQ